MAPKRGKNKAKPKRRKQVGAAVPQLNTRRAFQRACTAFYDDHDPDQALKWLQQIEAQGHLSIDVMGVYLDVLHQLRDFDQYARIATMMAERCPEDPIAHLHAASGAYATMQPVSAILYFERFLKLAPEHPEAPMAEEELAKLRRHLPEILDVFIDDLPKDLPRIASVEKILHVFKLGRFDDVIKRAEKHLQTYPNDLRIRNNLAEALALKGDAKPTMKIIEETLELAPNNFFARAVRCRLAYFQGDREKSRADAAKLMSMQPRQLSDLTKAAQSFAFIGDADGIRWAFEEAEKRNWLNDSSPDAALLTNYYATSLALAGDRKAARSYWKQAVKLAGKATTAQDNLDDLRQPPGEQWGPAYFGVRDWLSRTQQDDLRAIGDAAANADDASQAVESLSPTARGFLTQHPEVERLLPAMLARGDADSQRLALLIARGSQHQDVTAALLAYVHGPRGTDEIRYQLLTTLKEQGHTFVSPLPIYVKGKVQQIELFTFEITDVPKVPEGRTDESCELIEAANDALHEGNGVEAERLLRQARQIEPDQPDVLNNLAAALQIQDRMEEADLLIDELIEKHPDYFFGKIAAANRKLRRKQYDEAFEMLLPLQRRERLHWTEFFVLAKSLIYTFVGKREYAGARQWLEMLRQYAPDHSEIPSLERYLISQEKASQLWRQMFKRS